MVDTFDILSEFSDVTPENTKDPVDALCRLSYTKEYEPLLGILYACIKSGELSNRVFRLTESIIMITPSFITPWIVRQNCITKLGVDWKKEFEFLEKVREISAKCYQTWMHRTFVVSKSRIFEYEKDYCNSYIELDNKNIHAWTHRLWVVKEFDLWEGELSYTNDYIQQDIFNNSAWSYRFTVFTHLHESTQALDGELDYALSKLNIAPHNEACWNYISGLMKHYRDYDYSDIAYEAKRLLSKDSSIVYAYAFLIEYNKSTFEVEKIQEALHFCQKLEELDETRRAYWVHVAEEINTYYGFLFDT